MDISVRAANPDKPCSLVLSTGYATGTQAKLQTVIPYYSQMLGAQSCTSPNPNAVGATLLGLFPATPNQA